LTDVSEVLSASIIMAIGKPGAKKCVEIQEQALMIEAASTSETSVNFYQATGRNIPDDSHLHNRRR
jgi:hypothetical protein